MKSATLYGYIYIHTQIYTYTKTHVYTHIHTFYIMCKNRITMYSGFTCPKKENKQTIKHSSTSDKTVFQQQGIKHFNKNSIFKNPRSPVLSIVCKRDMILEK